MTTITPSVSYKPFRFPWAVNTAVEHEKIHWGEWEAKLQEDVNQWKNGSLSSVEKNHITQILRLFTQSDVEVASNYINCFLPRFKNNEIRAMLISFASREFVHQRAYALLNDTLGLDEHEYSAFLEYEDMKQKIEFMKADLENPLDKHTTAKALAQSACNEGMSLFSAFVMLLNYQRFGKMKGTCEIVEWSIRDETVHVEGMTKLFEQYLHDFRSEIDTKQLYVDIQQMFREAVSLEDKIIDISYEMGETEGLSRELVKEYIRYIANRRLAALGIEPIFKITKNPIEWLDWVISGDSFKNFFEGTVTDYNADGMTGGWGW